MRQHPVPQNITSYQFRLIGDITLKQFLQLLSGGVVGFVFFSTNLPSIIKWFFIIMSVLTGAGLAFMPIEGRSLDKWILAFIRSIYKPTQFHWKKSPKLPVYLSEKSTSNTKAAPKPPKKNTTVKPVKSSDHGEIIHKKEVGKVSQINKLFSDPTTQTSLASTPPPTRVTPPTKKAVIPSPQKTTQPTPPPPSGVRQTASIKTTPINPIKVTRASGAPKDSLTSASPINQQATQPKPIQGTIIPPKPTGGDTTVSANLNPDLPFPSLPESTNTLVGMVFTKDGKIVDNAVIEIQDQSNRTVRATKTNKIGQFFLATPLDSGSYFIKTEKKDLSFNTISLQLEGKIYPPLEIRAD